MVSTAVWVITAIVITLVIVGIILLIINISGSSNGLNDSCNNDGDCKENLVCNSPSGTCRIGVGGTCNSVSDCVSGADCISNTCVIEKR